MAPDAIVEFNDAFACWCQARFSPRCAADLELDEMVGPVAPWVIEARTLVGRFGLRQLSDQGGRLRQLVNTVLDACERSCESSGTGFP